MVCLIRLCEFFIVMVRDCGGNLMPPQGGMTDAGEMKMPGSFHLPGILRLTDED